MTHDHKHVCSPFDQLKRPLIAVQKIPRSNWDGPSVVIFVGGFCAEKLPECPL